jgi:hypothetical protein
VYRNLGLDRRHEQAGDGAPGLPLSA